MDFERDMSNVPAESLHHGRNIDGTSFATAASGSQDAPGQIPSVSPAPAAQTRIVPGPDGVVTLPAGVTLDDVKVVGTDLVVQLPDGTQLIIVDGAVFVPQLVVADVQIPPANLAALLMGEEIQPAAGPPQSSGGNFALPVGTIGDPFALGDLLPPTALHVEDHPSREILPAIAETKPTVGIVTPENPIAVSAAVTSVNEAGLPARAGEPAGSNAAATSEITTGTIQYSSGDQPIAVAINGIAITAVGQTFVGPVGTLTITSIAPGAIGYS